MLYPYTVNNVLLRINVPHFCRITPKVQMMGGGVYRIIYLIVPKPKKMVITNTVWIIFIEEII